MLVLAADAVPMCIMVRGWLVVAAGGRHSPAK